MRKLFSLLIPLMLILSLCSCGEKNETPEKTEIDVEVLADALLSGLDFDIKPEEIDGEVALSDYAIDESIVSDVKYFRVGSAVADEIAIFRINSESDIETVEKAVAERISYLKNGFSDYKPSEVPKIEKAYSRTVGNIVILCICNDPSAIDGIINSL